MDKAEADALRERFQREYSSLGALYRPVRFQWWQQALSWGRWHLTIRRRQGDAWVRRPRRYKKREEA